MVNRSHYLLILLTIIIISLPSVCFSELKTVEGQYCEIYLGNLKNKKELGIVKNTVRRKSIEKSLHALVDPSIVVFTDECLSHVISNYLEKVVVVSHTEKGRKICDTEKITLDPEVINKYLSQEICIMIKYIGPLPPMWYDDINVVLKEKTDKINIGLIFETKTPDSYGYKREQFENEEESQFYSMVEKNKDKYKIIDRRHLSKLLEEQKLSATGITDSDTVRLGKILNLDIIVLRLIYEDSKVTKVLKVDTGEVLLFKTYKQSGSQE
jgi:hypothetical protein